MDKKKTIIAIILFVFLGLMVFSFANPADEESNNKLQNSENGNTTTTTTTTAVKESNNNSSNRNNQNVTNNENVTNEIDYTAIRDLVASLKEKVETATNLDMMALAKQYNSDNQIDVKVGEIADETVLEELTKALEEIYKVLKDETKPTINVEDGALLKEVITLSVTDDNDVTIKLNGEEVENNTEVKDGVYELEVIDKAFNTTGIVRFTVDTVLPEGTVSYDETEITNKDVLVTITTKEKVTMPEDWTEVNETTYTKVYSENKTEKVVFKDVVGNEGTVEVKIENIDKVAPTATYKTSNDGERTNKDVTVTVTTNEEVAMPEGWTKVDETTYTKVYSENTTETVKVTDLAGNTLDLEIEVKNINKVASKVESIVYSTTDKTNQDVTVTVTFDKAVYAAKGWTMDGKARVYKKTYAENTEETVTFKDLYGNTTDVEVKIENIDKVAPTATYKTSNDGERTNKDVTVTVTASEEVVMPEGWTKVDETTYTKVYSENTTETITIKDLAGNTKEIEIIVKNINKVKPEVKEIKYSTTDLTNQDVTVTITFTKPIKTPKGWTMDGKAYVFKKTYSENSTETIEFKDLYGNTNTYEVKVDNIDKVLPTASIGGTTGSKYWKQTYTFDVVITEENLDSVYYIWNGSSNDKNMKNALDSENAIKVDLNTLTKNEDGTYTLKVTTDFEGRKVFNIKMIDKAGNVNYQRRGWYQIDNTAPSMEWNGTTYEPSFDEIIYSDQRFKAIAIDSLSGVSKIYANGKERDKIDVNGESSYTFKLVDKAGNTAEYKVVVDKTPPKISGLDVELTNKNEIVTISDKYLKSITINSVEQEFEGTSFEKKLTHEGTYVIVATDLAGNHSTDQVTIDKTPITINGIDESSYVYDGVGVTPTSNDEDIKDIKLTKDEVVVENYELGTAIVNAGTYVLEAIDNAGNKTTREFTIEKATPTITMTPEDGSKFRYDETAKLATATLNKIEGSESLEVTYKDDKGYKHTEPIKPGKYIATAVFKGDENYKAVEASVKYQIIKAKSSIEFTGEPSSLVYDGTAKEYEATVTLVNGTKQATMTYYDAEGNKLDSAPVNAGSYKVVASFKGDTLHDGAKSIEKEFTIEKATPTIEVVEPSLVYNGEAQVYEVIVKGVNGEVIENPSMNVVYKNADTKEDLEGAPVNAGNYTIGIYVRPTENYTRADLWKNFTVEKATPTIEVVEPSLVYNGEAQAYEVIVKGVNGEEIENPSMNVVYKNADTKEDLEGAPVNAGNYTIGIYVRPTENYTRADLWKNFTVEKADLEIVLIAPESLVYDGTAKEYKVQESPISQYVTLTYYELKDLNNQGIVADEMYKLTSAPTEINVHGYRVVAEFAGNENYEASTAIVDFEITKQVYETQIVTSNPECIYSEEEGYVCTYDGKPKVFNVKVFLGNEDVTDEFTNDVFYTTGDNRPLWGSEPVEVGTYYVRFFPGNYEVSENSKSSVKLTIVENKLKTIELVAPENLVYDGTAKEYKVKESDISNDVKLTYYEINGETETELLSAPINAGDYKVVAKLESDKYIAEDVIETFTIEKARITMTINYPNNVYDGNEKDLTFTFTNSKGEEVSGYNATYSVLPTGDSFTHVALKEVGTYAIYIDVEPASNENIDVVYTGFTTFEIIQGETEATSEFTYEESGDTITITGYNGNDTTITLPLEINGKKVTRLSDDAFANSSIKVLVIPSIPSGQRLTFNFTTFNSSSLEYIDYKGSKADITINDKNFSSAINVLDKSFYSIYSPLYTWALGDATAYIKCTDGSIIHVNQTDGFVDKA